MSTRVRCPQYNAVRTAIERQNATTRAQIGSSPIRDCASPVQCLVCSPRPTPRDGGDRASSLRHATPSARPSTRRAVEAPSNRLRILDLLESAKAALENERPGRRVRRGRYPSRHVRWTGRAMRIAEWIGRRWGGECARQPLRRRWRGLCVCGRDVVESSGEASRVWVCGVGSYQTTLSNDFIIISALLGTSATRRRERIAERKVKGKC